MVDNVDEVVRLTKKLVDIQSEIPKQGEESKEVEKVMAETVTKYLSDAGIIAEMLKVEEGRFNVISEIGPGDKLMINGHMDTVPMTDALQWRYGYKSHMVNGKIYGLGASDMKGGLAAMLVALSRINLKNMKRGLLLTFVADEEGDFKGSKWLFENKPNIFKDVKYGIIGEATDMRIQTEQKGLLDITITFNGKSAHASTPEDGDNAISKAARFVSYLEDFKKNIKGKSFLSGGNTINVGTISGGMSHNTVPDKCVVGIDIRTSHAFNANMAVTMINGLLREARLRRRVETNVTINHSKNSFKLDENTEIVKLLKKATGNKKCICGSGYTEAELYYSKAGIKCAVFGPGSKKAIHRPNEYVKIDNLKKAENIYQKIMSEWCL
jgi:succinyl-diaminopimelate desuccinylase